MATERADAEADPETGTDEGVNDHLRAVMVTAIAALAGVAAAFASEQLTAGMPATAAATSTTPLLVVAAFVGIQPGVLRVTGLLKEDFGAKDFLYIAFMTVSMWFIVWTVLLTTTGSG